MPNPQYAAISLHDLLARELPSESLRNLTKDLAIIHDMAQSTDLAMPLNDAVAAQFRSVFGASLDAAKN